MNKQSVPWVDKYRPNRIDNIVHQKELMRTLKNIVQTGEMPHLLFYGPPGTGKTTTILALANELFGSNKIKERILELNASDDRGINVVRNDIITFAKLAIGDDDPKFETSTTKKNAICPSFKILILDEADAMTPDAQSALRKVMEETSTVTRFCLICNYVDKIIEPIISRCMQYRFMPISSESMVQRLKLIAHKERINLENEIYDVITDVVDGDLRKGIMLLQNIKYLERTTNERHDKKIIVISDVYDLVGHAPNDIVKTIITKCANGNVKDVMKIGKEFYALGYSTNIICSQMCKIIVNDETMDENIKSNILKEISNIQCLLNDRSDECIQFVKLLVLINTNFKRTKKRIT